jgi:hypothetical protein
MAKKQNTKYDKPYFQPINNEQSVFMHQIDKTKAKSVCRNSANKKKKKR